MSRTARILFITFQSELGVGVFFTEPAGKRRGGAGKHGSETEAKKAETTPTQQHPPNALLLLLFPSCCLATKHHSSPACDWSAASLSLLTQNTLLGKGKSWLQPPTRWSHQSLSIRKERSNSDLLFRMIAGVQPPPYTPLLEGNERELRVCLSPLCTAPATHCLLCHYATSHENTSIRE